MFEMRADLSAISTMTITNCKEVTMSKAHNMRVSNVSVLIDFVRVMSRYTAFGSKRELCDNVRYLVLWA
jgi:hypothetical protein